MGDYLSTLSFSVVLDYLNLITPVLAFLYDVIRDWSKSFGGGGVGRSREGVGHQFLSR